MKFLTIFITIFIVSVESLEHWILQKDLQRELAQCPQIHEPIKNALKSNHLPYGSNTMGTHNGQLKATPKGHFIVSFDHIGNSQTCLRLLYLY